MDSWWLFAYSLPSPHDTVPEQGHARAVAVTWIVLMMLAYTAIQIIAARRCWRHRTLIMVVGPVVAIAICVSWLCSMAFFTAQIWDPHASQRTVAQFVLAGPITTMWHRAADRMLLWIGAFGAVSPVDWMGSGSSFHRPPDYLFIGLVTELCFVVFGVTIAACLVENLSARGRRGLTPRWN